MRLLDSVLFVALAVATASAQDARLMKAPEPGHPLNPADVAVLTGKNDRQQAVYDRQTVRDWAAYSYIDPYVGGSGRYGDWSSYDRSIFAPVTTRTSPPLFINRRFGRFHSPFFVRFPRTRFGL